MAERAPQAQAAGQSVDENTMFDRAAHAETRRLHRELRSPLPAEGEVDVGVDHVDDLRELWDGLVAESVPVEPAVHYWAPPPAVPQASAPAGTAVGAGPVEPVWPAVAPRVLVPPTPTPTPTPTGDPLIILPDAPRPADPPAAPVEVGEGDEPAVDRPSRRARRAARRLAKDERRGTRLERRRHRILPRTVIGISMMLLAAAIGAAVSGALLYAYYDWRLSTNEDRVGVLAESLQQRLTDAGASIDEAQQQALTELQERAGPLIDQKSDAVAMADLTPVVAPSTFFVATLDDNGQPSVGSAFVVASDDARSLLLTSYRTVAASTTRPGPEIRLSNAGGDPVVAQLYSWDPEHDLALLTLDRGGLEPLTWATGDDASVTGQRVYAASGVGAAGITFSPGMVVDQSADGIQMTAAVGSSWQGGPIVDQDGRVVAVASLGYQPLGFNPGQVPFAAPVDAACETLLDCGAGAPDPATP